VNAFKTIDPHLDLGDDPLDYTVKLQFNEGDRACFPYHYDNPGRPNKFAVITLSFHFIVQREFAFSVHRRKLTCLLYLNPGWQEGDGGELQLVPFLSTPVLVRPLMDRSLGESGYVLHSVKSKNEQFGGSFVVSVDL